MDKELAERLQRLEMHVAHLERQYEQLNEVLVEQSRTMTRLQRDLVRASDAVQTIELERIRANNPKPPHYQ
jgi:uncharacterized coiled-coil protein SlyX